jgi:decaprenylphospho-beta-D-erythro-pentofuranosid-2-ulose 2-reductase
MKNILVLGATSGIAEAIATKFAQEKNNLILAARNIDALNALSSDLKIRYSVNIEAIKFEALDFQGHQSFYEESIKKMGSIDGVVLCFGYLGDQREAEKNFDITRNIIDINFTSAVSILDLYANYFEEKREGFVCALSSVAGDRGRQSNYFYGAAKGALSIYLQGLRNRLNKSNVFVTTVKPGFVDTRMTYGQEGIFLVARPEKVANDIYKAIQKKKHVLYTPFFWKGIMFLIRNIPEFIFKKMKL